MDDRLADPEFLAKFLQEVDGMLPQGDGWSDSSLLPADGSMGGAMDFEAGES